MSAEKYYKQRLSELKGPRLTSDLMHVAERLFESAYGDTGSGFVIPKPTHFVDDITSSRVWWVSQNAKDSESFEVRLFDGGLTFVSDHQHVVAPGDDDSFGHPVVDYRKTSLVLGSQRPVLFAHDGISARGHHDVLRQKEVMLPAIRKRLDHTMAVIGIHESAPDIDVSFAGLQELVLAN